MERGKIASFAAEFKPALFKTFENGYGKNDFRKDLFAGLTVGVVALPLAMAFSIGAGGTPAQGLYTAIVGGLVIAFLGGSFHQVSGPTGAFVVIIADIIARQGMDGLFIATIIAGLILIAMGLSGLGSLIKFIPYPVTVGFTTGIGVIIFAGQLKDLFGMQIPSLSPEFFGKIGQYVEYAPTSSLWASLFGVGTVVLIFAIRKLAPKVPAAVTAVVLVTAIAFFAGIPVETVGSRYGAIPKGFPVPSLPAFSLEKIRSVFPSAVTIAMLAAIESLLSAVVADGMTGTRHSASAELMGQGLGNIASVLFGGIPATGAIARTATNIKAGARSPVAAIVHALVLLLFTLFLGPAAEAIPLAALAGVLVVVAWDMSELPRFLGMRRAPKSDMAVMLVTFVLTVVVDLTAAVQVGVLLAVFLFIKRMADTTSIVPGSADTAGFAKTDAGALNRLMTPGQDGGSASDDPADLRYKKVPAGCEVFEINGPFFFGVADMLQDALKAVERPPVVFVLRMRHVPAIDASGLNALASFRKRCKRNHTTLILSEMREQPGQALAKMGLDAEIGSDNLTDSFDTALTRASALLASRQSGPSGEHKTRQGVGA
ncbi:MAG: sulfate permease [Rectinema sp.]